MAPGNRRVDGDGLIHADVHGELDILIEDVVVEFPGTVGPLGPLDHRPFDHVRIVGPGRMDRIGRDVLAAGVGVELEVLLEQRLVLGRPGLEVVVPRHHPWVLPQVEPEAPVPSARQDLVLYAYSHLQRGATFLRADVDRPLIDAGRCPRRNVEGHPNRPDRTGGEIEPLEGLQPIGHEEDGVRCIAAAGRRAIGVVRQDVAHEAHLQVALAQHHALGVDEVTWRNPNLVHRIGRPDYQLCVQALALPPRVLPQAGSHRQGRHLAPHVRLIGGTERHVQPALLFRPPQ